MSEDELMDAGVESQEETAGGDPAADAGERESADPAGVLSEEEIAALRETGADAGSEEVDSDAGACSLYDFRDPSRLLNGRLPGLDSVHEAFCNGMQQRLKSMVGRSVEVSPGETILTRLGDYQRSLPFPTSVHGASVEDRKHSMYIAVDGRFVYACVDAYFGGLSTALPERLEREFSTSERRFMEMFAAEQFRELQAAWAPICALTFGEPRAIKPGSLGGGRDDQIMVVSRFQTHLNPGHVEFQLSMPYALLDGLRPYLTAGPRGGDGSRNWRKRFADRLSGVDLETRSVFSGVRITFGELVALQAGDFIPVSNQNRILVMVDESPLYIAEPGAVNGMAAAKIVARAEAR